MSEMPPSASQSRHRTGPHRAHPNRRVTKRKNVSTPFVYIHPVDKLAQLITLKGVEPPERARRITLWHRVEKRKIGGSAAPLRRNLARYIETHEQYEVYVGQEKWLERPGVIDPLTGLPISESQRVVMWNLLTKTKITGKFAPTLRDLAPYLDRYPYTRIYRGQDLTEKAIKAYREEDRRGKNKYKNKNVNNGTRTSSRKQENLLQQVNPMCSADCMKLPCNESNGPNYPTNIHVAKDMIVSKMYCKEKDDVGSVEVLDASKVLTENDSATGHNTAKTQFTFSNFPCDIPNRDDGSGCTSKVQNDLVAIGRCPSWCNLQLWRNHSVFHSPRQIPSSIPPVFADRSTLANKGPIDWSAELGDDLPIDRSNKTFKSMLAGHAHVSTNETSKLEVELEEDDFLQDQYEFDQPTGTDPIDYYLIADDETVKE